MPKVAQHFPFMTGWKLLCILQFGKICVYAGKRKTVRLGMRACLPQKDIIILYAYIFLEEGICVCVCVATGRRHTHTHTWWRKWNGMCKVASAAAAAGTGYDMCKLLELTQPPGRINWKELGRKKVEKSPLHQSSSHTNYSHLLKHMC